MSRTVLAPAVAKTNGWLPVQAERHGDGIELAQYGEDDCAGEQLERLVLTEPEARALRDWLCEQFGLPEAKPSHRMLLGTCVACGCTDEVPRYLEPCTGTPEENGA